MLSPIVSLSTGQRLDFQQLADYHACRIAYPGLLGFLEITDAEVEQAAYRLNDENNPIPLLVCVASALGACINHGNPQGSLSVMDQNSSAESANEKTGNKASFGKTCRQLWIISKAFFASERRHKALQVSHRPAHLGPVRRRGAGAHELCGEGFHDRHREEGRARLLAIAVVVSRHVRPRSPARGLLPVDGRAAGPAVAGMDGAAPDQTVFQQPRLLPAARLGQHRQPGPAYQRGCAQLHRSPRCPSCSSR